MAKLAIHGGTPVRTKEFPSWPVHDGREKEALLRVLESGQWGGYPSPNTEASAFAHSFAAYHDAQFGVCTVNGTVTLLLSLRAGGVGRGDEVIVPPYTFAATAAAPIYVGAVPVFADVRKEDYTLDPAAVEAAITERTRAVICVHLGGAVCDLDALRDICQRHNLILVEDCAHMHGAKWNGRGVGSHGDFGSFSFQSSKLMTAGEGGLILTHSPVHNQRLHSLIDCGRTHEGDGLQRWIGYNFRITEWQAAILKVQLERLEAQNKQRAEGFERLDRLLADIPGVSPVALDPRVSQRAGYQYIFRFDSNSFAGRSKNTILQALAAEGIPAEEGYAPLHHGHELLSPTALDQWYGPSESRPDFEGSNCPVTDRAFQETVWLDHQVFLGSPEDVDDIAAAVSKVQHSAAQLIDVINPGANDEH